MEEVTATCKQRYQGRWGRLVASAALWALYSRHERAILRGIVEQVEGDPRLSHLSARQHGSDERRNEAIYRGMTTSISHHRAALGIELAHHERFPPKYRKHEQQVAGQSNQHRTT